MKVLFTIIVCKLLRFIGKLVERAAVCRVRLRSKFVPIF